MAFTRYPEWNNFYVERLSIALASEWDANRSFRKKLSAYFEGELPYCKEIIPSTLMCLLSNSAGHKTRHGNCLDPRVIPRVSYKWPGWAEEAVRASLDTGIFDGFKLSVSNAPGAARRPVYMPFSLADTKSRTILKSARNSGFSIRASVASPRIYPFCSQATVGRLLCTTSTPVASIFCSSGQSRVRNNPWMEIRRIRSFEDPHAQ